MHKQEIGAVRVIPRRPDRPEVESGECDDGREPGEREPDHIHMRLSIV